MNTAIKFIIDNHLGDYASVIGLLIAVPGFVLTLRSVRKTRSAAESARKAAEQTVKSLAKADTVIQITVAISVIDEIRRMHRQSSWPNLPDRYSSLRRALISIKESSASHAQSHQTTLQDAISQISVLEDQIEQQLAGQPSRMDIPRANRIMAKQADALQRVLENIKTTMGG